MVQKSVESVRYYTAIIIIILWSTFMYEGQMSLFTSVSLMLT